MFWSLSFSLVFTGIQSWFCQRCFLTFKKKTSGMKLWGWQQSEHHIDDWISRAPMLLDAKPKSDWKNRNFCLRQVALALFCVGVHNLSILGYHLREMQNTVFHMCLSHKRGAYFDPAAWRLQWAITSSTRISISHSVCWDVSFCQWSFLLLCGWFILETPRTPVKMDDFRAFFLGKTFFEYSLRFQTPWGWRCLDPKNIPKTPNLRRYLED